MPTKLTSTGWIGATRGSWSSSLLNTVRDEIYGVSLTAERTINFGKGGVQIVGTARSPRGASGISRIGFSIGQQSYLYGEGRATISGTGDYLGIACYGSLVFESGTSRNDVVTGTA